MEFSWASRHYVKLAITFILNAWETSNPTAKTKRAAALSFLGSEEFYQASEAAPDVLDVEILSGEGYR